MSYAPEYKNECVSAYREVVRRALPAVTAIVEQVERSFAEKFAVKNPYKLNS